MEHLSVHLSAPPGLDAIRIVRAVSGASVQAIRDAAEAGHPVLVFDYSGNAIDQEVAATQRVLAAFAEAAIEVRLTEHGPGGGTEPVSRETVETILAAWQEQRAQDEALRDLGHG